MLWKKSSRVERIKLVVKTNKVNTYRHLQLLHSSFSVHLCFPLGTMKPCFVSEKVTRADPRAVRFDKILIFWATIVIQIFYILSEKCGQLSTLFEFFYQTRLHSLLLCRKRQQKASHNPAFNYSTQFHVSESCSMSSVYWV